MTLQFDTRTGVDGVTIRLEGRIDGQAGGVLDAAYASTSGQDGRIGLDFEHVDYINSTGIALIVGLLAKARAQRRSLRATGLTPHYQHIFEITRLSDFIEIVDRDGSALAAATD
jgi:anti-sigma B factor antagonist